MITAAEMDDPNLLATRLASFVRAEMEGDKEAILREAPRRLLARMAWPILMWLVARIVEVVVRRLLDEFTAMDARDFDRFQARRR